jgi:WD40 repeat protein
MLLSFGEALEELGSLTLNKPVATGAISENGETICIAEMDGTIHAYGESLANERWTYATSSIVHSVSISDDGKVIAAAADSGKIYLFNEEPNSNPSRVTTDVLQATVVVAACIALLATAVIYATVRKQRLQVKLGL